jgi:hypothetical protein
MKRHYRDQIILGLIIAGLIAIYKVITWLLAI